MRKKFPRMNIQGALIFAGEHLILELADSINDIQVLMRNEFRNYIWQMTQTERNLVGPGLDIDACIDWIDQFRAENPFKPEPISEETARQLRKGICCSHCGSFAINTRKSYVSCPCGMHEPRENAIVRTICEYGVIYFDKELKTSELLAFFGEDVSRTTILNILNKHFIKLGSNRTREYKNLRAPFHNVSKLFNFDKRRYFILNE